MEDNLFNIMYIPDDGATGTGSEGDEGKKDGNNGSSKDLNDEEFKKSIIDGVVKSLQNGGLGLVNLNDLNKDDNNQNKNNQDNGSSKILEALNTLNGRINNLEGNVLNNLKNENTKTKILSSIPQDNLEIAKTLFDNMEFNKAVEKINALNLNVPRNGNYNQSRVKEQFKSDSKKYSELEMSKDLGLTEQDFMNGFDNGKDLMKNVQLALGKIKLVGAHQAIDLLKDGIKNSNKGDK